MTPRIMNLRTGITTCLTCGQQRSWDIQVCPNPNCGKRVVAVQHADGTQEVDPAFGPQAAPDDYRIANRPNNPNWHGVGAWFDEAAANLPKESQQWSTNEAKAAQKAEGEVLAAALAQKVMSAFDAEMRRLCADYEPEDDYHNEGVWK